jgi:hypothetical protein
MRLHTAVLAFALAAPSLAWGQAAEIPERVLRLSYVEGVVGLQAEDAREPTTLPDRPLIPGDRLITQDGGRAELALDTSAVRLDERTELRIEALEATSVRMGLSHGVASLRLRELLEGETFEIATTNASITLREPGEYRVEAQASDLTVITVRGGAADVATAAGPVRVASGQRVRLEGREAQASLEPAPQTDDFDDWVLDREVRIAEVAPSSYGFDERANYDELDRNGDWYDDSNYGHVWMPNYAYGSWDPYGHGQWQRYGYGWSWISSAPWGFFTFNSGRWAFLHDRNRWCWVPSPHPTPHVARETHPFGHVQRVADPRYTDDGGAAMLQPRGESRGKPSREVRVSGSTPQNPSPAQPAATPQSHTATMRPSSSSNTRTSSPSTTAPRSSVFAAPSYP